MPVVSDTLLAVEIESEISLVGEIVGETALVALGKIANQQKNFGYHRRPNSFAPCVFPPDGWHLYA